MKRIHRSLGALVLLAALLSPAMAGAQTGAWYLALDAEPFGLPPGTNLGGLATFHRDKTLMIEDGGDFGGLPFETLDSAQVGSWRKKDGRIEAVTLYIQGDASTGEVLSWFKVHFVFEAVGPNEMVGTVNVLALPCDDSAPFRIFGCPDPIASAPSFTPLPPFDVPVRMTRLRPRFVAPD